MASASPFRSREERDAERRQKREAVLHAAVRMFNAQGFHATSLDDVAASLGISKPTIYHYLGNKDQVLLECLTHGLVQLRDAADTVEAQPGSGLDKLRRFLRRYGEIMMEDFGRCVVRTPEEALSEDSQIRFRTLKREIDGAMRTLIDKAVADGSIRPVDVRLTAFAMAGALNWTARWHRPDGPSGTPEVSAAMVEILTAGLQPQA